MEMGNGDLLVTPDSCDCLLYGLHGNGCRLRGSLNVFVELSGWGYYYISNALHDHYMVQKTS